MATAKWPLYMRIETVTLKMCDLIMADPLLPSSEVVTFNITEWLVVPVVLSRKVRGMLEPMVVE